ncbi:MAG TPA: Ku protein [Acidimicrobiales bacterium]|nr:Ku protein [Acidimicrobiales bacterium]
MARSVWKGTISFGLVSVPVKAFSAVRDHDVHFHQIDKDSGSRVRNQKIAEKSGDEVGSDDIAMGFEVEKGRYVTFDKDELDELRPDSTRTIDVTDFVALDEVDPIYYERTYWLAPDGDPAKQPYHLLRAAMEDRDLVAIGTVVMRNKNYLTAIRPLDGALAMSTMRFADEVVPRSAVDEVPARRAKPDPKMLRMATQLVDSLTGEWKPNRYKDTFTDELRKRIEAKQAGEEITSTPSPEPRFEVVDLMEALEASISEAKGAKGKSRKTTSASKAKGGRGGSRARKSA